MTTTDNIEQKRLPDNIVEEIIKWQKLVKIDPEQLTSKECEIFRLYCATVYIGNLAYKEHIKEISLPYT